MQLPLHFSGPSLYGGGMDALQLACPSGPPTPLPLSSDLIHHQEVLYGFPVGKDHISSVFHGFRQDLLHLLGNDTWRGSSQVVCVLLEGGDHSRGGGWRVQSSGG